MDTRELETLCLTHGLRLHERSEHHYQICRDSEPLVDVWPSTNKFLRHRSPPGKKATVGPAFAAVELAKSCKPSPSTNGQPVQSRQDVVNHPPHYTSGKIEVIDAIEGLGLGFHAGNVLKYIARYKLKNGVEDLRKAAWYLNRLIESEAKA